MVLFEVFLKKKKNSHTQCDWRWEHSVDDMQKQQLQIPMQFSLRNNNHQKSTVCLLLNKESVQHLIQCLYLHNPCLF